MLSTSTSTYSLPEILASDQRPDRQARHRSSYDMSRAPAPPNFTGPVTATNAESGETLYVEHLSSEVHTSSYEDKDSEDVPGEELGPNSRFYNVYLDEVKKHDDDMLAGLSGTLDALLMLAALFSGVVTTFFVDTSHSLEPDHALIISSLLFEQAQLLRANGNATIIAEIPQSQYTPGTPTHSKSDVWINGLFLVSLSLSLATALLSVLAKQWLQAYSLVTTGSARNTTLVRHFRFTGLQKWKVPQIINCLPLILHASLGVFMAGLIVLLQMLRSPLSVIVIIITGLTFLLYMASVILPAIYIQCPYRISVLYKPMRSIVLLVTIPVQQMKRWLRSLCWWLCCYSSCLQFIRSVLMTLNLVIHFALSKIPIPTCSIPALKEVELQLVQSRPASLSVLFDAILWLHDMTLNSSVREVAAFSLAGEDFLQLSEGQIRAILHSKVHITLFNSEKNSWAPGQNSSPSQRAASKLANHSRQHNLRPEDYLSDWFDAARLGRTNHIAFFFRVWEVPIDEMDAEGWTALMLSVQHSHYATTKLLLELGANPNFLSPNNPLQNCALSLICWNTINATSLEIGSLLFDAGADVNLRGPGEEPWTPLSIAVHLGHVKTVQWLLDNGANVNMVDGPRGAALHIASHLNYVAVVKVLLKNGAKVNIKNENGVTALEVALAEKASGAEALLRQHGATE